VCQGLFYKAKELARRKEEEGFIIWKNVIEIMTYSVIAFNLWGTDDAP
jgi:hypothetical protein